MREFANVSCWKPRRQGEFNFSDKYDGNRRIFNNYRVIDNPEISIFKRKTYPKRKLIKYAASQELSSG